MADKPGGRGRQPPARRALQPGKPDEPGETSTPGDPPVSAANRLSAAFYRAIDDDFETHGAAAIASLREKDPKAYVTLAATLARDARDRQPTRGLAQGPAHGSAVGADGVAHAVDYVDDLNDAFDTPARPN